MADTKISNLPEGTPAQGSDNLPVQRGSSNVKLSVADIAAYSSQNPENLPAKTLPANLTGSSAPALPASFPEIINALQHTGTKWYVDSVNGKDSNTGTSEFNAFKSLDQAQSTANSGDAIYITDGFTLNTPFSVKKNLIFFSQGTVNFNEGVVIEDVNTRWEGVYFFNSINTPAIEFKAAGYHYFDEINVYATYNSKATQKIASAIHIPAGATVFIDKIGSLSLVTLTGDQAPPETLTRATHIYTHGSYFSLSVSEGMYSLLRSNNGVQYNIYYSEVEDLYSSAVFNNSKIAEYNSGQNDNTINDLFIGSKEFGHIILVNTLSYISQNFRIDGPKIRLANCDSGANRSSIVMNNITIQPAYLENGDILLSNATTLNDVCCITGCTILNNFTLAVSGLGQNIYSYVNDAGQHYSSYAQNETFNVVLGNSPITNNAITGAIQLQAISLDAGATTTFRFNNTSITHDTPISFGSIFSGVPNVNIVILGTSANLGFVTVSIQNFGTENLSGPIYMEYVVRTNYHYA